MKAMKSISACVLSAVMASTSFTAAFAGTVETAPVAVQVMDAKGPVTRVNKGDGMVNVAVGDSLKAGDEVFAGKDSAVSLYFASAKCSIIVPASTVYKVADKAPCDASAANIVPTADVPTEVAPIAGIAPGVLLAGALVVGAGAVVVIATTNDDNNNSKSPASPD